MSIRSTVRSVVTLGKGVTRGLPDADVGKDPMELFGRWFEDARESGIMLSDAAALSTADADAKPSGRMVLLKGFDERGFRFFTNFGSRKSRELDENPRAALTFHWAILERQVRIEGTVDRLPDDESDAYFKTRARGSQIGAWASRQSEPLTSREELKAAAKDTEARFAGSPVPLPPFWGGYRLVPERIEFWQGRANRLHDRVVFDRDGSAWRSGRLYP
jgi:pyridoxamine 5'-phosphate oxidase